MLLIDREPGRCPKSFKILVFDYVMGVPASIRIAFFGKSGESFVGRDDLVCSSHPYRVVEFVEGFVPHSGFTKNPLGILHEILLRAAARERRDWLEGQSYFPFTSDFRKSATTATNNP